MSLVGAAEPLELVQQYCVDCHSGAEPDGDRDFSELKLDRVDEDTVVMLQDIIDQLTLGEMPPEDAEQPTTAEKREAIDGLTRSLKSIRQSMVSTGGQTVLRRLNRREYLRTVGDLMGIDMTMFDPTVNFPRDNTVEQLDNVGDALVTSGYLLEQYLIAADAVVEKTFADLKQPAEKSWTFDGNFRQQPELNPGHKEAFNYRYLCLYDNPLAERPEGAYGPLEDFHEGVHADGIYEVKVLAHAVNRDTPYDEKVLRIHLDEPFRLGVVPGNAAIGDMHTTQPIQPLLAETTLTDGEPQWYTFRIPLDRGFSPRFTFQNGMTEVRPTYGRVMKSYRKTLPEKAQKAKGIFLERIAVIHHGKLPHIRIHEVSIRGPIVEQWPPAGRSELLGGQPFAPDRVPDLLKRFADRAFRRPADNEEVARLIGLYEYRVQQGRSPLDAMKDAMKSALCSPAFLYLQPGPDAGDAKLSQHALASRLSYFLIGSMPDAQLRAVADSGQLSDPVVLRQQARRLLADPRTDALVEGFTDSWLNLRALGEMPPDRDAFSQYYTAGLRDEMKRETQMFTRHLIDNDLSILDFLRGNYSFINRDLARLYGITDAVSSESAGEFRKVVFDDKRRGGLLGQASVLTVTANGIETSPVIRGVWLLENILGTPPAPPPDDVPPIDPDVRGAKSIRDLLEKHRSTETCNACHRKIDPLGFALECFDPIGGLRSRYENKAVIDTSGQLPGGRSFEDVSGLKEILLERKDFFARMLTTKLMAYALGRRIESSDRGEIDAIVDGVREKDYPMRSLIEAVVLSEAFGRR
ncbi:hypothetical protein Pla52n_42350 [Stieleria varia]|uniref:Planctomycete cytochrome C n=2 Tax=Stieleria varia TaxID=2528005 RepID=A0A5C6AP29_9BACT|nr:hypothetical protein Pla52n_42350 [Stieleria varia]